MSEEKIKNDIAELVDGYESGLYLKGELLTKIFEISVQSGVQLIEKYLPRIYLEEIKSWGIVKHPPASSEEILLIQFDSEERRALHYKASLMWHEYYETKL